MTGRKLASIESAGLVKVRGAWFYVIGTDGEFMLDYASYDPEYDPAQWADEFRGGLLTVGPDDGFAYLQALKDMVFAIDDIESFIEENGAERVRPIVLIDFDRSLFVSTFFDLPLEDHAGLGWESRYADLFDDVPDDIATHWRHGTERDR